MIITMDHVRRVHYCSDGVRVFFKKYNLDLHKFCKEGFDEEVILATGDDMAITLVEEARRWEVAQVSK